MSRVNVANVVSRAADRIGDGLFTVLFWAFMSLTLLLGVWELIEWLTAGKAGEAGAEGSPSEPNESAAQQPEPSESDKLDAQEREEVRNWTKN